MSFRASIGMGTLIYKQRKILINLHFQHNIGTLKANLGAMKANHSIFGFGVFGE